MSSVRKEASRGRRVLALATLMLAAALASACSGPRVQERIERAYEFATRQAVVMGVIAAASLALWLILPRRFPIPPPFILLGMVALHPAWTISAAGGDCGESKVSAALLGSVVAVALVFVQLGRGLLEGWGPRTSPKA